MQSQLMRHQLSKFLSLVLLTVSLSAWSLPKTGGDRETVDVPVVGVGYSEEDAKRNGLRQAVEQTVGTLLISDKEVNGDKLMKEFIGDYSAGYVDHYTVVDTTQENGQYRVRMTVTVASSKIAQRMLSTSQDSARLSIENNLANNIDQRNQGDLILSDVLESYPSKAYTVEAKPLQIKVNELRQPYAEVYYNLSFNNDWLDALIESLNAMSTVHKQCGGWAQLLTNGLQDGNNSDTVKNMAGNVCGAQPDLRVFHKVKGEWFRQQHSYYFQDVMTLKMINEHVQGINHNNSLAVRVILYDDMHQVMDTRCGLIFPTMFVRYNEPVISTTVYKDKNGYYRPDIIGGDKFIGVLHINLAKLSNYSALKEVQINIDRSCN